MHGTDTSTSDGLGNCPVPPFGGEGFDKDGHEEDHTKGVQGNLTTESFGDEGDGRLTNDLTGRTETAKGGDVHRKQLFTIGGKLLDESRIGNDGTGKLILIS